MEPWMLGVVAVLVVGMAVIVIGALVDRGRNRRRTTEMLSPPPRVIPHLPAGARGPAYVSELQARRAPVRVGSAVTGPSTSSGNSGASSGPSTSSGNSVRDSVEIDVGWASKDFADGRSGRVVLQEPVVVVCSDEVASMRELLPVLERALRAQVPLVLAAPAFEPTVLGTLEVNAIQRKLALVVVFADQDQQERIAELSGATPIDRSDRQAGYLAPGQLGRVERWVTTKDTSTVTRSTL